MGAMEYFYWLRNCHGYKNRTAWASTLSMYCGSKDELCNRMNNVSDFWRKHSLNGAHPK